MATYDPNDADSLQVATTPDGRIIEVSAGFSTNDPDEVAALTYLADNAVVTVTDPTVEPPPPEPDEQAEAPTEVMSTSARSTKASKG